MAPTVERKFVFLRWHYKPHPKYSDGTKHTAESYPISEDVYPTLAEAIKDAVEGQVGPIVQAVEVDLGAGTARDVTKDVLGAVEADEERRSEEEAYRRHGGW